MRKLWPLVLAAAVLIGCGPDNRSRLIPLATDGTLSPPTLLGYAPGNGLVALVTETGNDGNRQLALWRADSTGAVWTPWAGLGRTSATGRVALAVTEDHVVVAGVGDASAEVTGGQQIWIERIALSAAAPADGAIEHTEFTSSAPVLSLAMDAPLSPRAIARLFLPAAAEQPPVTGNALESATPPIVGESTGVAVTLADSTLRGRPGFPAPRALRDSLPWVHLVYLTREPDTRTKQVVYRHSSDAGATWSDPETLAEGDVGRPEIFARSRFRRTVDVCYPLGEFMHYRSSGNAGEHWLPEKEIRLRVAAGSSNGIARHERELLTICENDLHQVAGAMSLNSGYNWERAISIARQCDHVRLPAIDHGGGLFWVGFSQGDTAVVVRSTVHTLYPKQWNKSMFAARACCLDAPDVAALPDSTVGVLFGTPEGEVFFVRVRQPAH
ncbi:MAG: hypothetical protein KAY32_05340 [Candidatus Eisenbacteria sp.]|nr:hypothetical protein [Candidatus Eisenbacteria bacterium]